MKQRLLPLLLAFVLFLTACGDATTETDSASDSGGDRVENASDDSGGWLGGVPADVVASLEDRGHQVQRAQYAEFGHAHLITVTDHGTLAGSADPRAFTGAAAGL
ncbi:MAG: gamma-glutamyltransferase [Acidimicrobiales bacterium]|jgi:gamma-glutamyltranspeptidase|nr:gamma-glutamyltransferase [Acidimicrobiales bacterium]